MVQNLETPMSILRLDMYEKMYDKLAEHNHSDSCKVSIDVHADQHESCISYMY